MGGAATATSGAGAGSSDGMRFSGDSQSGGRDSETRRVSVVQPITSARRHARVLAVLNTPLLCEWRRRTQGDFKTPNTKVQTPGKLQTPNPKGNAPPQITAPTLAVGVWRVEFFDVWCLAFGV